MVLSFPLVLCIREGRGHLLTIVLSSVTHSYAFARMLHLGHMVWEHCLKVETISRTYREMIIINVDRVFCAVTTRGFSLGYRRLGGTYRPRLLHNPEDIIAALTVTRQNVQNSSGIHSLSATIFHTVKAETTKWLISHHVMKTYGVVEGSSTLSWPLH